MGIQEEVAGCALNMWDQLQADLVDEMTVEDSEKFSKLWLQKREFHLQGNHERVVNFAIPRDGNKKIRLTFKITPPSSSDEVNPINGERTVMESVTNESGTWSYSHLLEKE